MPEGRLSTDGDGNVFVDDPSSPDNGTLVRWHEGGFVAINPGDPSHNETHHQQFATMEGTRDSESVRIAAEAVGIDPDSEFAQEMVNAGAGENMHHFETQEDDPHYDPDAPNKTRAKTLPDIIAPTVTSHTNSWQGGSE